MGLSNNLQFMDNEARTLKYGDIVRIHGMSKNAGSEGDSNKGILMSKGFTDPNIYYQRYSEFAEVNWYREALFQIIPKTSFHINDELLKENLTPKQREAIKVRAASEEAAMLSNLNVRAGTEVVYGAEVIFKHVDSNSFLHGVLEAAESGQGSFKINLTPQLSSHLSFKIRSHRSYERDGDKVYLDDPLQIYHISTDCFMNFSESDTPVFLDRNVGDPLKPDPNRPKIKTTMLPRSDVVNQNKYKCLWKLILYEDYESCSQTELIKPHDLVYFQHTKNKGNNKGIIHSSLTKLDAVVKELRQSEEVDEGQATSYYDSLWELIPPKTNESGPDSASKYYVRNMLTGRYLWLNSEGEIRADYDYDTISSNPDVKPEPEKLAMIELMDTKKEEPMASRDLVNISIEDGKLEIGEELPQDESLLNIVKHYEKDTARFKLKLINELSEHSFAVVKPPKQILSAIQFVMSSFQCIQKFCEMIQVAPPPEQDSTKEDFSNFYSQLMGQCTMGILGQVSFTFKELIGKIYECDYSEIDNAGNSPNKDIQRIMVETGLTQLTFQTLNLMTHHSRYLFAPQPPADNRSEHSKLIQIFQDGYKLLEKIVVNNSKNRIYISRWVERIMEHSYQINQSCIQECLVGILENNSVAIRETITEKTITTLVEMFVKQAKEKGPQVKYLRLLSAFIKCADNVIKVNQDLVLQHFFRSQQNYYQFRFKSIYKTLNDDTVQTFSNQLTKLGNSHEVQIGYAKRQDKSSFADFFKNEKEIWNYFLEYVNLMADVCMERNENSIEVISSILPLQEVLTILSDPNIMILHNEIENFQRQSTTQKYQNIYEPFIRIAHHVYVNIKKFSAIRRISKIKYWYALNPDEDIPKTKRVFEGEKQQGEKKFLGMILDFIKLFLNNCKLNPNNMMEMKALYTTLDLLRITVTLGLWNYVKQFRELLPALFMKIIKFDNHYMFQNGVEIADKPLDKTDLKTIVAKNKQNIKMIKPEMQLAIKCKTKAAEIFSLMIEMETNIRVSSLVLFFKGIYDSTEDFGAYKKDNTQHFQMTQPEADRDKKAKSIFLDDEESSPLFIKPKKKRVQHKEIMLEESIWLNKLREITPIERDPISEDGECRRYFFDKIGNFEEMILALLEVSEHMDWKMLNSSMLLLRKIFSQRSDLIQNFNNVVLCAKGNFYDITTKIREMKYKFNMLKDPEILEMKDGVIKGQPYPIWKPYDQTTKEELKRSGIIQDLFFLSRVLKQDTNLKNIEALMTVDESFFDCDHLVPSYTEKQQNDRLFQTMALVQQVHLPIFEYIKLTTDKPEVIGNEYHYRLLRSIYNYLTLLVFNNLENKQHLMQYIPLVLPHLKCRVGTPHFIYNICYNNKILVNDEVLVQKIINGIIEGLTKFSIDDYERSNLLFAFRGLVMFNEKGHKRNQKLVVNMLQKHRELHLIENGSLVSLGIAKKSSVFDFDMLPRVTYMSTMFELLSVLVENKNMINIGKLSNIHTYQYLLQTLREATHWQLRRSIRAYINRLYYINKDDDVFLFEEFIRNEFFIISQELTELVELYNRLHEDLYINNSIRFAYTGSQTYLALLEILTTLFTVLEKPVFSYKLTKELAKRERKNEYELHNYIVKIANNLGYIATYRYTTDMRNKMTGSYIKQVLEQLRRYMQGLSLGFLEETCGNQVLEEEAPEDLMEADAGKHVYDYSKSFFRNLYQTIVAINIKKKKDRIRQEFIERKNAAADGSIEGKKTSLINFIFSGKLVETQLRANRIGTGPAAPRSTQKRDNKEKARLKSGLLTSNSKYFKVLAKPTLDENQQNLVLNKKLKEVKSLLWYCPIFQKFRDDQFYKFVAYLTEIDETSKKHYQTYCSQNLSVTNFDMPVVSVDEIIRNIFRLTIKYPKDIEDKYKIPIIKLIRCYLSEAIEKNQQYKLCVDLWDAEYVANDAAANEQFSQRQVRIQKCGGAEFIVRILEQNLDNRIQVLNEILLLGIVFLFGGNSECQNSILNVLTKDESNAMLVNLNELIKRTGNFVYSMSKMKVSKDKRPKNFNYAHEDAYDYYNSNERVLEKKFGYESEDKMESKVRKESEDALCRSFRFLQLLCENNNIAMKNFLLVQINENGSKKNKTINFIETTTILLRKFFKIMNRMMSKFRLSALLDFINETTQIPCLDNQIALTKSSYFEDVCYMSSFFASKENQEKRLFNKDQPDTLELLYEIYDKSIQLALSNLEGNDDKIYTEFINKCEGRFLWEIVQRLLEAKIQQYKDNNGIQELTLNNFDRGHIEKMLKQLASKNVVYDDDILNILNIFTILKKVNDFSERSLKKAEEDKQNINKEEIEKHRNAVTFREKFDNQGKAAYHHMQDFCNIFEQLLLQIEVNTSAGRQYIYFPFQPIFNFLAKSTKNRIMAEVTRETQRDKLIGLLSYREEVFNEIDWNFRMKQKKVACCGKQYTLQITSSLNVKLRNAAMMVSCIIMLLMMTTLVVDHYVEDNEAEYNPNGFLASLVIRILSLLQLGLSLGCLGVWIILKYPLAINKEEREIKERIKLSGEAQGEAPPPEEPVPLPETRLGKVQKKLGDAFAWIKSTRLSQWLSRLWFCLKCLFKHESEFGPLLMFVFVSIIGNLYGIQYFTIHIFDIFLQVSILGNVFKAIAQNAGQLFILSLLAGAFIFVFNVLSLSTYAKTIYDDDHPDNVCQNLAACVLMVYNSGAINDSVDEFQPKRFAFDIVYMVFMELLFQNLVGGVIIDTFMNLREIDEAIESDKNGMCFICGKDRASIENQNEVFINHIKPHDLWSYLYFIYCLQNKDETNYSGMEYEINDKIQNDDVGWFPTSEEGDEDNALEGKMNELHQKVAELKKVALEGQDKAIKSIDDWTTKKKEEKAAAVEAAAEIPAIDEVA